MGNGFNQLKQEVEHALAMAPLMKFKMPDPKEIEMIQRDLSEKDARIQRARAEMERLKDTLGLTEEELREVVADRRRNGRTRIHPRDQ
jgi:septal ring factor EnvC (AmiA/AmiB activator)